MQLLQIVRNLWAAALICAYPQMGSFHKKEAELREQRTPTSQQQIPLTRPVSPDGVFTAKITDYSRLLYLVDLEVGTPPQSFRAVIDTSWNDLFSPSKACTSGTCSTHQRYDSNKSSTYVKDGAPVNIHYAGLYTSGFKSRDTASISLLTVSDQIFEEATEIRSSPFYWDDKMDSVLGLARLTIDPPGANLKATSWWHNVVSQNLIKRNLFSLKLSKSPHQDGELMFGDVNRSLFKGDLKTLPLTHVHCDRMPLKQILGNGWQIAAHSLSFGTDDQAIHVDLSGYTAAVMTYYPWIAFPQHIANKLQDRCGGDYDNVGEIECEKRAELPELILRLGSEGDVEVRISPWDYVMEMVAEGGGVACAIPFVMHPEVEGEPDYIILGAPFLTGVYSVWDHDGESISFAELI